MIYHIAVHICPPAPESTTFRGWRTDMIRCIVYHICPPASSFVMYRFGTGGQIQYAIQFTISVLQPRVLLCTGSGLGDRYGKLYSKPYLSPKLSPHLRVRIDDFPGLGDRYGPLYGISYLSPSPRSYFEPVPIGIIPIRGWGIYMVISMFTLVLIFVLTAKALSVA